MSTKKSGKQDTKKQNKKKTEEPVEVKQPAKKEKKSKKQEVQETETEPETQATETETQGTKTRYVATRESVEKEFDELIALINDEVTKIKEAQTKSKGVKFLRTINKKVKTLKTHALKVAKQKNTTKRVNNNSGFLKPVNISADLANFTGWDPKSLKSRVDVTRYICNYIKEKNLQDPEDRRKINVDNDPKLKKLLKFDASKDKKPVTYPRLQTYLKTHFTLSE